MGDLGMFGFWMFIAACVIAGIWSEVKGKETKQETLRRIVESGRDIDPDMVEQLIGKSDRKDSERELRVGSYIMGGVSGGVLIFSAFLGIISEEARWVLMGVSALVACIGGGLYFASRYVGREKTGE
ncbi:MAG: hypothetical protein AAGJ86_00530 [Pseudomonadota bacterium]